MPNPSQPPSRLAEGQTWRNPENGRVAKVGPVQPKAPPISFGLRGRHRVEVVDGSGRPWETLGLNPWDTTFLMGMGYTEVDEAEAKP